MPAALTANARAAHRRHLQSRRCGQGGGRAAADRAEHCLHVCAGNAAVSRKRSAGAAAADDAGAVSARGVHALEGAVLGTPGIDGIVLRYGRLYGPGTWAEKPTGPGFRPRRCGCAGRAAGGDARRARHLQHRRGRRRGGRSTKPATNSASTRRFASSRLERLAQEFRAAQAVAPGLRRRPW